MCIHIYIYVYIYICVCINKYTYIYIYISLQPILCPCCKARCLTRSTAIRWPLFFWISGMLLIMFDALVPTGICVILFLRSLTPYSQEVERKQSLRLHETTILGFLTDLKLIRRHMFLAFFTRLLVRAAPLVLSRTFLDSISLNVTTT